MWLIFQVKKSQQFGINLIQELIDKLITSQSQQKSIFRKIWTLQYDMPSMCLKTLGFHRSGNWLRHIEVIANKAISREFLTVHHVNGTLTFIILYKPMNSNNAISRDWLIIIKWHFHTFDLVKPVNSVRTLHLLHFWQIWRR